jgi:hypothetical protein
LIEVLVALLCISIILVGFVSIFRGLVTIWLAGSAAIDMSQNVAVLTLKMSPELRSALPPYQQTSRINFIGINTDSGVGTQLQASAYSYGDEIKFHVAARSAKEGDGTAGGSGAETQKRFFWLKHDPAGSATDYRIQTDWSTSDETDSIVQIVGTSISTGNEPLAYNIREFNVEYRDAKGAWTNNWNAQTRKSLPSLVRVSVRSQKSASYRDAVFVARPFATDTRITRTQNTL